jgi:hypothetical protein
MATMGMAVPAMAWGTVREDRVEETRQAEEGRRVMDCEAMERMPLEELLYYVLVGDGRKKHERVDG